MRVLFTTTPLDGHFRPLLPLAHALRARGHDVAFATEAAWHPIVAAEGFDALAAGRPHAQAWQHACDALGDDLAFAMEHRLDEVFALVFAEGHAHAKVLELAEVAETWAADAIVYESGDLAGPAVARALGLPAVHHSWGAMLPLTWFDAAAHRVGPAWHGLGLSPPPRAGAFDGLYIDLSPPTFRREPPPGRSIDMRPVSVNDRPAPAWVRELEPPLVYATLGTLFNDPELLRVLVEALDVARSAVVTTGRDVDPHELGDVPAHVRVERFLPQAYVLPLAAAAVGHGGSGSTFGALAHAVPLVLIPMGADQFDVATCAASAGAAVVLHRAEATPASVREALSRVLSDGSYARAARDIQTEIDAMETPDAVAASVEAFVAAETGDDHGDHRTRVRPSYVDESNSAR